MSLFFLQDKIEVIKYSKNQNPAIPGFRVSALSLSFFAQK